jgi:hypothetical protein
MGNPPQDGDDPRGAVQLRPRTLRRIPLPYRIVVVILLVAVLVRIVMLASGASHHTGVSSGEERLSTPARARLPVCGASCDPIDPRYLTDVPFGRSSFWIQPWRAYLDTWPVSHLRDSLGINFNVKDSQAAAVARLLHDSGFRFARLEIPWGALSYDEPTRFVHEASLRARLSALHAFGLRPLILLNANSGGPAPARAISLETVAPARAGASTVMLTPASAAMVVPGRSGFNPGVFHAVKRRRRHRLPGAASKHPLTAAQRLARRAALRAAKRSAAAAGFTELVLKGKPDILITKVDRGGAATISRPLPSALASGPHRGTTLLYPPFASPTLPDGSPNPTFQATLRGWLAYVAAVSRLAQATCGPGGYDLEIWNELSFGSQFLNVDNYYAKPPGGASRKGPRAATREVVKAILDATVAYARDPAHGISPAVGITDGFASQSPFFSGALAPRGLTALSKHPYAGLRVFPSEYHVKRIRPTNALGEPNTASRLSSMPRFTPHYQSLLPEYTLTATSTETLIRDLAPFTTRVTRAPHGRYAGPAGQPPPQLWITEYNLGANATPTGPDEVTPQTSVTVSSADKAHFRAKALLRSLVAMVSKGVSREYFFAAAPGALSLVGEGFFSALEAHPGSYPGDRLGGEVMRAFHNTLAHIKGPGPNGAPRRLKLLSIVQEGNHAQFRGDGTAAHPDLYDREVLAVFPYQTSPTHYVIPIYVMTRNLLTLYRPAAPASDVTRYDLPNETFRITLGNLPETKAPPVVVAYDPLRDQTTRAKLLTRQNNKATFELAVTDYPRLLNIDYGNE